MIDEYEEKLYLKVKEKLKDFWRDDWKLSIFVRPEDMFCATVFFTFESKTLPLQEMCFRQRKFEKDVNCIVSYIQEHELKLKESEIVPAVPYYCAKEWKKWRENDAKNQKKSLTAMNELINNIKNAEEKFVAYVAGLLSALNYKVSDDPAYRFYANELLDAIKLAGGDDTNT